MFSAKLIPEDVQSLILALLALHDLKNCRFVCSVWHIAVNRNEVWKKQTAYYLPGAFNSNISIPGTDWLALFKANNKLPDKIFINAFLNLLTRTNLPRNVNCNLSPSRFWGCESYEDWFATLTAFYEAASQERDRNKDVYLALYNYIYDVLSKHRKWDIELEKLSQKKQNEKIMFGMSLTAMHRMIRYPMSCNCVTLAQYQPSPSIKKFTCKSVFERYSNKITFEQFKSQLENPAPSSINAPKKG